MKVVKCVNGHFFDEDKYTQCPHCGGANLSVNLGQNTNTGDNQNTSNDDNEKKKKHKFFGGKKKEEKVEFAIPPAASPQGISVPPQGMPVQPQGMPVSPQGIPTPQPVPMEMDDERTVLIEPVTPPASVMERPPAYNMQMQSVQISQNMQVQQNTDISQSISEPQNIPLSQSMPVSHVISQRANQGDNMQTVAFYDSVTEPVTGWLVCIKGESYGESFELKAGRNNIGRGTAMDVPLLKEMSISRDKHAVIVFDPVNIKFLIQSGENGLTYVNEELLMGVKDLKVNDRIMMGTAVFMFVPFCGDNFDWKDYQNN